MEQLIIGTAGHVDHGKTVLIRALTGVDTDRLQEEKERGISIDLGFAPFRLPSGRLAGIVDVPGHERFIHNMLAGAAGMDLVMLVIDASEGVMPQTREHLDILGILGLRNGIVVITKIDLVEEEWRELVSEEIEEELAGTFMEGAPVVAVSALKDEGIGELKALIDEMTSGIEPRSSSGPLRLPVDRSFVIAGFGTVITGTLVQGMVKTGDTVAVVPPGLEARVRNIQVHDADVGEARAGSRVALNLSGLEKDEVQRGSVVGSPGCYRQTDLLDVSLELLPRGPRKLKNLDPVHFFLGTARCVARLLFLDRDELRPGEKALVQCRLDRALVAERGDAFVVRSYSPMTTIGGGRVLDPHPARHRRFRQAVVERLEELRQEPSAGGDAAFLRGKLDELVVAGKELLAAETRLGPEKVAQVLNELTEQGLVGRLGDSYALAERVGDWEQVILAELGRHHRASPLSPGISRARLKGYLPKMLGQRDYDALLGQMEEKRLLQAVGERVAAFGFEPRPSGEDAQKLELLVNIYNDSGMQPPPAKTALEKAGADLKRRDELYGYLGTQGVLVRIDEDLYFHCRAFDQALALLKSHFEAEETLTLARFRDLSGTSRKYAQALLEHFDREKITRRVEDHRVPFRLKRP